MSAFFSITVCSLPDYEQLVAEIYVNDKFVGLLSQENGPHHTVIELEPKNDSHPTKLDLDIFEQALAAAKQKLWELRRTSPPNE